MEYSLTYVICEIALIFYHWVLLSEALVSQDLVRFIKMHIAQRIENHLQIYIQIQQQDNVLKGTLTIVIID